jgi:hypothetical protein
MTTEYTEEQKKGINENVHAMNKKFLAFLGENFRGTDQELMSISGLCLTILRDVNGYTTETDEKFFDGLAHYAIQSREALKKIRNQSTKKE